jgi:hypothetical protein
MKSLRLMIFSLFFALMLCGVQTASAQCAMCTTTVESNNNSGASTTKGLNKGIMFLLGAPYLAVCVVGIIWYKKYRRKNVNLQMRNEKLHLN